MFRSKDKDGTGWLKADELEECLNMVGVDIIPEDMEFLQERFDKNGRPFGKQMIGEIFPPDNKCLAVSGV